MNKTTIYCQACKRQVQAYTSGDMLFCCYCNDYGINPLTEKEWYRYYARPHAVRNAIIIGFLIGSAIATYVIWQIGGWP